MKTCLRCGATLVPHAWACFDCGLVQEGQPPPWRLRRLEVSAIRDRARLARALHALGVESSLAQALVTLDRFALSAELTQAELETAQAMLSAAGAEQRVAEEFTVAEQYTLRWEPGRWTLPKLGAAVVLGAGGAALALPLVLPAAIAAALVEVARAVDIVPHEATLPRNALLSRIEVFDPGLLAELRQVRKALTDPGVIELARRCVIAFAELDGVLRARGGHVLVPELGRLDLQCRELLRRMLELALACDRQARRGAADPRAAPARAEAERHLEHARRQLDALGQTVADLLGQTAQQQLLQGPLKQLSELKIEIEAALEVERALA